MERLTDRQTAAELKKNVELLQESGIDVTMSVKRYIKLAEYENRDEQRTIERVRSYDPYHGKTVFK